MSNVSAGYKQTEVGVIPEDWEVSNLESITDPKRSISYGIVQTGPNIQNGIRCLRVVDIEDGKINSGDMITTSKTISDSYKRTILKAEDLVMPLRGKVGDIAIVKNDLAGCNLTRGVALIAVRPDWSAHFCRQYISSPSTRNRLEQSMNGSALQEIPIAALRSFKIALPPTKAEQEAIAEALSDTDALIEALEQLITKKRHLKQGTMQKLLTGKKRLPEFAPVGARRAVPLQCDKHHQIPDGWEVKTFGDVFNISAGGDIDPKRTISYQDQIHCYPIYSNALTESGLYGYCSYADHQAGTITVTARGTLGFANYRDHAYTAIGRVLVLHPKQDSDGRFLAEVINSRIRFAVESTGVPQLTAPQISAYSLTIPPAQEQTAIAAILSDMDSEIAILETKLAKTRQLKQGMMHNLLTGRIRLIE